MTAGSYLHYYEKSTLNGAYLEDDAAGLIRATMPEMGL